MELAAQALYAHEQLHALYVATTINTQQIHARRETRARFDPNSLETNT